MTDYQINIPSYQRSATVANRTLAFLGKHNINREQVTIWVANEQEHDTYRKALDSSWRIGISALGLVPSRCHYHQHHAPGTPIVNIDDDVSELLVAKDNRLIPYPGSLDKFITQAFTTAERCRVRLWGINGAANAMYLKQRATMGLRYLVGAFFGSYAHDPIFNLANRNHQSSGEDFEATLMAFERDNAVLRYDGVTIKTAYFAEGGIDAELKARGTPERQADHAQRLVALAKQYPDLAATYTKAGGVTNIRLKPITALHLQWEPN